MHVSGRGRGISELDLGAVFASEDERNALSMVKSLDLSHNLLTHVSSLHPLSSLETLVLAHNRVTTLRSLPLTLTSIDLSFNQLASVEGLHLLPSLVQLDLSHNRLHSLAGLQSVTSLEVIKATGNRIATTDGLDKLSSLKVLLLDKNVVASTDSLWFLRSLGLLDVVSFAECPVAAVNGYRDLVARLQTSLLSIDGSPVLRPARAAPTPLLRPKSPTRSHDVSSRTAPSLSTSTHTDPNPSDEAALRLMRRQLQDAMILLEQEQKSHQRTRQALQSTEGQLQDSKRLIREQLEELSALREERSAHLEHIEVLKGRLTRLHWNSKYQKERHHLETLRLADDYERDRTQNEVHISELRQRIAEAVSTNTSHSIVVPEKRNTTTTKHHRSMNKSDATTRSKVGNTSDPSIAQETAGVAAEAAGTLARQLKDWMVTEVRRQSATPSATASALNASLSSSSQSDRENVGSASSPRTAARNITKLWKRNEERRTNKDR